MLILVNTNQSTSKLIIYETKKACNINLASNKALIKIKTALLCQQCPRCVPLLLLSLGRHKEGSPVSVNGAFLLDLVWSSVVLRVPAMFANF